MKVSTAWLQTFFDAPLPGAEKLENALTFHSSEIEEVIERDGSTVLDVKVLPDKSAWMLSHRGVAKELSTILELPLSHDPLATRPELVPHSGSLTVSIDTERCNRYTAAVLRGVSVGPSPEWLTERLASLGQRSINNVVDATNYVMFHMGQPLHAFDAAKLRAENGKLHVGVRMAHAGEEITTLTGETYTLSAEDMLIVDRADDEPIGIAGVKGGARAEVDERTTDLVIESANFDRVSVRKTAQRLKLRTDASARFENGIVPECAAYGLAEVVKLITELAGGTVEGYVDEFPRPSTREPVSVSVGKIVSVLGLPLTQDDVDEILGRFGYERQWTGEVVTVTPPFERDDLVIPEDLIEEIGRIHGLTSIASVTPEPVPLLEINPRFHYAEAVRTALIDAGFSEVFTSSFRKKDEVKLENALASDKGYLRSSLRENLAEALLRNVQHKDLLGLDRIAIFEIGTVFTPSGEHLALAFGVRTGAAYSPKKDDPVMAAAMQALAGILGSESFDVRDGIAEIDLSHAMADLPQPSAYAAFVKTEDVAYAPFSNYPSVSRDIALWVSEGVSGSDVEAVLNGSAGELCVRTTLFDEFTKDGRTSYAFRLVFQSKERTLTDTEVNEAMERVYESVKARGWDVR